MYVPCGTKIITNHLNVHITYPKHVFPRNYSLISRGSRRGDVRFRDYPRDSVDNIHVSFVEEQGLS